jgi:hypothetical protein
MKTTNFFIDYLVIGMILLLGFLLPIYSYDRSIFDLISTFSTKEKSYIIPLLTISLYISGIIYNQISDVFLSKFSKVFGLGRIEKAENRLNDEINGGYHAALQKVVITSQSAYDFLSFRRSIIRIFRALTVTLFLSLLISIMVCAISSLSCITELYIFWCTYLLLFLFVRYRMIKLEVGYYRAISNFYTECELIEKMNDD